MTLYSLKDSVAGEFAPPFIAKNDGVAQRVVVQMFRKMEGISLSDFHLYRIGEFSEETGMVDTSGCPSLVVDAPSKEE